MNICSSMPVVAATPLVSMGGLTKHFSIGQGRTVYAVNGVDITIARGETLGLVGESGSGKTTVGHCLLGLTPLTDGKIVFDGVDLSLATPAQRKQFRTRMQIVFQEPGESLDPRHTIARSLEEPLLYGSDMNKAARRARVTELLQLVKLPLEMATAYPHRLTAGEQQRVCVARAIATNPDLIVLDEPTASLDFVYRREILDLLDQLQRRLGMSYLFISHDLNAVRRISHRVAIMYLGSVVEVGPTEAIFSSRLHPYGRALLASVLEPTPHRRRDRFVLTGEIPSPINKPVGCPLAGRCPLSLPLCSASPPPLRTVMPGHRVACHRLEEIAALGATMPSALPATT